MLSRLSLVFKLIAFIFLSSNGVFAIDEEPWSDIITKDFNGSGRYGFCYHNRR